MVLLPQGSEMDAVLKMFQEADEEGTGSIERGCMEELIRQKAPSDKSAQALFRAMNSFVTPQTGGIDYARLLHWAFQAQVQSKQVHRKTGENQHSADRGVVQLSTLPLLARNAMKNQSAEATGSGQPPLKATVTGRPIAEAPPAQPVTGTKAPDFPGLVAKEQDPARGLALQQMTDMLSRDVFGLPFAVTIAITNVEDTPLIAISDGFSKLTGYAHEEIVGRNCRFLLEGVPDNEVISETRLEARRYCRAAHLRGLNTMSHSFLIQRNARKNGELFWNLFMLSFVPAPGANDEASYVVGLQLDLGDNITFFDHSDVLMAVGPHRKNLETVQKLMFGPKVPKNLAEDTSIIQKHFQALGKRLPDDVRQWIQQAEIAGTQYQEWGTLPWAVWPTTSQYALMNGGTTLLRLEADEVPRGGLAMSIFPVKKLKRGCYFKLRVDEVSAYQCDLSQGGQLPSVGFTELSSSDVDALGGLPSTLEAAPVSVSFGGDGQVFVHSKEGYEMEGGARCHEVAYVTGIRAPCVLKPDDMVEYVWGAGLFEVSVNGEVVYLLEDPAIPKPAKKPIYGVVDCCFAACKLTLIV
eukprot:TRINITY_DN10131_c0_g1_i1.p1 TRINITY_DN10131_c0_g1~~TRINITY_DN10131_c0_g1_i1.p1  ORF type:complete len:580 (-),score=142.77 TRINITY_DN10131_c0_g1_i1:534-2273(-)